MGGCISVSVSCDQFVNQFSQWLCVRRSYIHSLTENLAALHKAMEVLKTKEDDVKRRVDREEFIGRRQRLSQVQVWLTNVASIEKRFNDMVSSTREVEIKRLCFCGFCSKSFGKSYGYGKMVSVMLKEVESLSSHGEFDVMTEVALVVQVEEMPIQSVVVGQETMLERVWNSLMKDGFKIMGLYGMGGVGKTTLLTQINNKFSEMDCGFDIVMWVVVSKTPEIYRIQEDIAKRLGLSGVEWDKKTKNKRAVDIHNVLRRKKFVLLLDDIWEKVNLESVGVPYPSRVNGNIVAFTTRSRDVCGRMGVDDPMQVRCLEPEEAWNLFQKKVGENTLKSHPDIPKLAKQVAEKCRGLPLALNVIGETMACKSTVQEWRHAIDVLTSSAIEFSGMEDEILPILKYSYDNLNIEHVKSCFLYCSLFPEDYEIKKEDLVDYWICEGFIDVKDGKERAINDGYVIIGTLFRTCLLEEGWKKTEVKMHDVVREMALWISSDLGKHKDQCIVRAGVGLHAVPEVKNWRAVRRMSLMKNELQKILGCPTCPELTTLLLQKNHKLVNISGEFFRFMPNLVVLDLSWSSSLIGLPNQISELVSLRYLDLSYTNIERLPVGLQELKKLIHLNLESMKRLESIAGVSKLLSLRTLRLQKSKKALDVNSAKELQLLEHLEVLTIDIFSSLVLEHLLCSQRLAKSIQYVELIEVEEESFKILTFPTMVNIRRIGIWKCGMKEIKIETRTSSCFSSLSKVVIGQCDGLKDLTWLLFAPNLTYLDVRFAEQLEDIISEEKAASFTDENANIIIPFQKLECLSLSDLPKLKSIYWTPLSFPRLSELAVQEHCPKLKKLPLNSKSGTADVELVVKYGENKWLEGVEWEDRATELRFLVTCKPW